VHSVIRHLYSKAECLTESRDLLVRGQIHIICRHQDSHLEGHPSVRVADSQLHRDKVVSQAGEGEDSHKHASQVPKATLNNNLYIT